MSQKGGDFFFLIVEKCLSSVEINILLYHPWNMISPTGEGYHLYSHGIIACYTVGHVFNTNIARPISIFSVYYTETATYNHKT